MIQDLLPKVKIDVDNPFYIFKDGKIVQIRIDRIDIKKYHDTITVLEADGCYCTLRFQHHGLYYEGDEPNAIYKSIDDCINQRRWDFTLPNIVDLIQMLNLGWTLGGYDPWFERYYWDGRRAQIGGKQYELHYDYIDKEGVHFYIRKYKGAIARVEQTKDFETLCFTNVNVANILNDDHPFWENTYGTREACVNSNHPIVVSF